MSFSTASRRRSRTRSVTSGSRGDDSAAFAGGDVLGALEAEADDVAGSADALALEAAAERVRRVFDDAQTVLGSQRSQRREVAHARRVVHRHDGLGARGDAPAHVLDVDPGGLGVDVAGDRRGAGGADGLERGDVGNRRHDDLVAGADAASLQRQVQRSRAGAHAGDFDATATGTPDVLGDFALEGLNLARHTEEAALDDDARDSVSLALSDEGTG